MSPTPRILSLFIVSLWVAVTGIASGQDLSAQVLEEMNFARTQPKRYAEILAVEMGKAQADSRDVAEAIRFLQRATPLAPLNLSPGMCQSARAHVNDLGPRGARGHNGSGGSTPFTRMNRFGKWLYRAGENIYFGSSNARGIVCALIVDSGVRSRGHRKNIFNPDFTVTGVAHGRHSGFGAMCVMDFAGGYVERGAELAGS